MKWKMNTGNKSFVGKEAGCVHKQPTGYSYVKIGLDGKNLRKTTIIWLLVHGRLPNGDVDHINGNSTDDRLCNLREATRTQNMANKRMHKNNKSGVKGVFWCTQRNMWRVNIRKNKKSYYVGHYKDKEEAGKAYISKAVEFYGQFATDRR